MFSYFGSKYRLAKKYPSPQHRFVIEPFAGSACYSLYYDVEYVKLYDINPVVCDVWDFLIGATSADILALPLDFDHIDDVKASSGAKAFIGFGLNLGNTAPCKSISTFTKIGRSRGHAQGWSEASRYRVSRQVDKIRKWEITNAPYTTCPDIPATWFIDPPYMQKGRHYPYSAIDRDVLARFCWARQGLVMVCDDDSARYLPFKPLGTTRGTADGGQRISKESIWMNGIVDIQ